jgi:pimeloyl-ACP methyl ester carboxylesterase
MQLPGHCTAVILALSIHATGSAQPQTPVQPAPGEAAFSILVRGSEAGRIQVNVARSGSGWTITSTGRFGDLTIGRFELKYTTDWQATDLRIEAVQGERALQLSTSFAVTTAINEITRDGATSAKNDQVSARAVVLPNNFFAAHEGLAARLAGLEPGAELPVYVAPEGEARLTVKSVAAEQLETPGGLVSTRKYGVAIQSAGSVVDATVTVDATARLARFEIPAASLLVVRSDLAGVAVRAVTSRNPTDSDVLIPAHGFTIAGTLTTPPGVGRLRHPTIVLVAGSRGADRDESIAGIPVFTQLAGLLSARGFLVLRYDKRGIGRSGGRTETATLQDYAEDVVALVKWLAKRDDVDSRRISAAGHGEGGAVAMLAASRERKISSLVLIAAPGTTGAELILEQQLRQLEAMKLPESDRQEKIALQKKIQDAVVTEKGWEALPPELRRQADTPWFRSLLQFDPAKVMPRLKQPILVMHGDLDTEVPPHHADRLGELARARKKAPPVEVVHLPGINHLLVPAETGGVQEYAKLQQKTVTTEVGERTAAWVLRGEGEAGRRE